VSACDTKYDNNIADMYGKVKSNLHISEIYRHTLMDTVMGDCAGDRILDVGCGIGDYTRLLKMEKQAGDIVGIDMSQSMVDKAQQSEHQSPLGISYICGDARDLSNSQRYGHLHGRFDLAVGSYVLLHATDHEELVAMLRGVYACVKPGGRFVGLNTNPYLRGNHNDAFWKKYGLAARFPEGIPEDGATYDVKFSTMRDDCVRLLPGEKPPLGKKEDPGFVLTSRFYTSATYNKAARQAGFKSLRWVRPELPDGSQFNDKHFWKEFLENSNGVAFEMIKP